jgi:hypothetical protein
VEEPENHEQIGSSDIGNVRWVVPAIHIHPLIAVGPKSVAIHPREFVDLTISESGNRALIISAKAMILTCIDLFANKDMFDKMKMEQTKAVEA